MEDCIFCKIASGEIKSKMVYDDSLVCAFADITPQAPVHILIIPKQHYASILEIDEKSSSILGHMAMVAKKIASEMGIGESGFRLVCNTGSNAGQTVKHLHVHLLGGRDFTWPPG